MKEIKKELAEIKEILLQLLKIQKQAHSYNLEQIKEQAKEYTMENDSKAFKI